MKKFVFIAAAAAAVLAGCAKNEVTPNYAMQDAVTFGAYNPRTITKGGETDDMNLEALQTHGFGVFASYTAKENFDTVGAKDDFMYNQKVAWDGSVWAYSPIKYWPNPTDGQTAADQKVSFFAYAPYADDAAIADNTYGITGFSIDGTTKHNMLSYTFAANKPNVDLMWGYKTGTDPKVANLNLTRTANAVAFTFQHLLSKLGGSQEGTVTNPDDAGYVANGLMIKANAETIKPTNDFGTDNGTKITVSRIIVKSAPEEDPVGTPVVDANGNDVKYATGAQTGKLDLYTGEFTLDSATPESLQFSQTLTDDASEIPATADSELAERIAEPASFANFAALPKGVTETAVNVYKDESNPIILIPGTAPVVDVQVTYIVRTYDEKLGTKKYSEVEQTVWNRVKFPTVEKNKKYNLLMILGLNDVKLVASVEDWSKGSTWVDDNGNGVVDPGELRDNADQETWLPENL